MFASLTLLLLSGFRRFGSVQPQPLPHSRFREPILGRVLVWEVDDDAVAPPGIKRHHPAGVVLYLSEFHPVVHGGGKISLGLLSKCVTSLSPVNNQGYNLPAVGWCGERLCSISAEARVILSERVCPSSHCRLPEHSGRDVDPAAQDVSTPSSPVGRCRTPWGGCAWAFLGGSRLFLRWPRGWFALRGCAEFSAGRLCR